MSAKMLLLNTGTNETSVTFLSQWQQIQRAWSHKKMPQSMLFVGSFDNDLVSFTTRLTQLIMCQKTIESPCSICVGCQMVLQGGHPDVDWVKPEKIGGPIKIEQIRALQNFSYLTPQRANFRLVVIESADRMNLAAANALLKILEEPPQHIIFLLIAKQLSTVLPTVLSRCHIIKFSSNENLSFINGLEYVNHYPSGSVQSVVIEQSEMILNGLVGIIEGKEHPFAVAAKWSQFDLGALLWFLYLIFAQLQLIQIKAFTTTGSSIHQLKALASLVSPTKIFTQIDKINCLLRKINQNINVNQTLVLEDLLLAMHNSLSRSVG